MISITQKDLISCIRNKSYLDGRWLYMKKVISFVQKKKYKTCLEVGPSSLPLFHDSDILDVEQLCKRPLTYQHDCNEVPWPIKSNTYDVAIALQVWEHLLNHRNAFGEISRVAKTVILSLPYKWHIKDKWKRKWRKGKSLSTRRIKIAHCNIDKRLILRWTGVKPTSALLVHRVRDGKTKGKRHIICFYERN